jgi:hypothetical protein
VYRAFADAVTCAGLRRRWRRGLPVWRLRRASVP